MLTKEECESLIGYLNRGYLVNILAGGEDGAAWISGKVENMGHEDDAIPGYYAEISDGEVGQTLLISPDNVEDVEDEDDWCIDLGFFEVFKPIDSESEEHLKNCLNGDHDTIVVGRSIGADNKIYDTDWCVFCGHVSIIPADNKNPKEKIALNHIVTELRTEMFLKEQYRGAKRRL